MIEEVKVTINGKEETIPSGTTLVSKRLSFSYYFSKC